MLFNSETGISVIMPTYNQSEYIARAINSLMLQTYPNWELIIINDGCTDETSTVLKNYLSDSRIRYFKNKSNIGLGASLNKGISHAYYPLIAYLPSDDIYHKDHLNSLYSTTVEYPSSTLVYSGIRHHYNKSCEGIIDGYPLQLVQVLHRKVDEKWVERGELVTDDLGKMFWNKLSKYGDFIKTANVSCEWVDHPDQRHKIIREPIGGINPYKLKYGVSEPLIFHSMVGNRVDEIQYFKPFRKQVEARNDGLKILLVGELAYNSERIFALEEQGHKLYGLWMDKPYWYNSVGPLPFGNVQDFNYKTWIKEAKRIKPDIIYALLNWQAVPFAHKILKENPGIPFVWHFKEGPFICQEKGLWKELIELTSKSDGQIYTSPEMQLWFDEFLLKKSEHTLVLDGDLPKNEWFTNDISPLLSDSDGEIHTVVPGRPIGLHPYIVAQLAEQKIHLHFYGDFTHGQWKEWITTTMNLAPGYLHTHPNVTQDKWVQEFSQYDAGWLHFFKSENHCELMKANWDDLNYPARMATLACAGIPMIQRNNAGHVVATQSLVEILDIGIFFNDLKDLGSLLRNKERMKELRENIWKNRELFSFDYHVDRLTSFFKEVINSKKPAARSFEDPVAEEVL